MNEVVKSLNILLLMAVAVAAWIAVAHRVLRPLTVFSDPRSSANYTLIDVVCLLLWLSLLGAGVSRVAAAPWTNEALPVLAFFLVETVGSWWVGVRLVSAAGVVDWRRRVACQLVIVPLALYGPPLALALPFVVLKRYEWSRVGAIWLAASAALLADYLLARWVARGATVVAASPPPVAAEALFPH